MLPMNGLRRWAIIHVHINANHSTSPVRLELLVVCRIETPCVAQNMYKNGTSCATRIGEVTHMAVLTEFGNLSFRLLVGVNIVGKISQEIQGTSIDFDLNYTVQ